MQAGGLCTERRQALGGSAKVNRLPQLGLRQAPQAA